MSDRVNAGSDEPILQVQSLVVRYGRANGGERAAVDDVSFTVRQGETVGLVGESGSGKTTIGKAILGLQAVTAGVISYRGQEIQNVSARTRRALSREIRAIFQDPYSSLDPRQTIEQSLTEPLRVHGISARDARGAVVSTLAQVGLPADSLSRLPREFSGGQRQRIAVARAIVSQPRLIICDEPVSALDLSTQAQVLNLLADLRDDRDLSYLFVAHDISVVGFLAQRALVLYRGQVMESGPSADVIDRPLHPFTQALTAASPVPRPAEQAMRRVRREQLQIGSAGLVSASSQGCPFASRCPLVEAVCLTTRPPMTVVANSEVACHAYNPDSGHSGQKLQVTASL